MTSRRIVTCDGGCGTETDDPLMFDGWSDLSLSYGKQHEGPSKFDLCPMCRKRVARLLPAFVKGNIADQDLLDAHNDAAAEARAELEDELERVQANVELLEAEKAELTKRIDEQDETISRQAKRITEQVDRIIELSPKELL